MKIETWLKLFVGIIGGIIFWFFWILVTMVYSFMPANKLPHEMIFNVVAPVLYLALAGKVINKIFSEKGWKKYLLNVAIVLVMALLSLLIVDLIMKMTH